MIHVGFLCLDLWSDHFSLLSGTQINQSERQQKYGKAKMSGSERLDLLKTNTFDDFLVFLKNCL